MFCGNCGSPINEGDKFCGVCGALSEEIKTEETVEPNTQEPSNNDVQQNVNYEENEAMIIEDANVKFNEEMLATEPSKKGFFKAFPKKKLIRIGIIAGVLAVLVAIGAWAAPYISNAFAKMTMSPEKYFQHVTVNWFKSGMNDVGDALAEAKDLLKKRFERRRFG